MSKKHKKQDKHAKIGTSANGAGRATAPTSDATAPSDPSLSREEYEAQLHVLQVELVKLQRHFIRCQNRILVVLEGRDAAGKDGSIKRIVEYLSPRETRERFAGRTFVPLVTALTQPQLTALSRVGPLVLLPLVGHGTPELTPVALMRATIAA